MENYIKVLKILNPVLAVTGVVAVVLGVVRLIVDGLGGLGAITSIASADDPTLRAIAVALVSGTVLIVGGFASLVVGLFGIRGGLASKALFFYTMTALIAAPFEVVGFFYALFNGVFEWMILINVLLAVACAVLAVLAKFPRKRRVQVAGGKSDQAATDKSQAPAESEGPASGN